MKSKIRVEGLEVTPKMEGLSSESGEESCSVPTSSRRTTKNTEEYRKRRERNNQAVKKSRMKTKMKTQQMMDKVSQLKTENEELENNIKSLTKELGFLKDFFVAHAGNAHGVHLNEAQLSRMLCEDNLCEESTEVSEGASLLMGLAQAAPYTNDSHY